MRPKKCSSESDAKKPQRNIRDERHERMTNEHYAHMHCHERLLKNEPLHILSLLRFACFSVYRGMWSFCNTVDKVGKEVLSTKKLGKEGFTQIEKVPSLQQ